MTTTDARKRLEERQRRESSLAVRLAEEYLPGVDEKVTALTFRFAWDAGHASGEHEVEQVYEELAEIVQAALNN